MVYLDWNKIMAMTPDTFTEDEKDEMVNSVVWYTPTSEIEREKLIALLRVMQEIIKHKIDQVESLIGALDELAAKQGEEDVRRRQDLLDELEDLREQLEYQRRLERDNNLPDDQLRSECVRLEMQNEELVQELQERDKDLTAEKSEVERLIGEVARLEKEKQEIARELTSLQEETNERVGRSVSDSPEGGSEKVEELVELVRQKNKHIMQLLDDIEAVEQDNQSLKVKGANMRDQLTECNQEVVELRSRITTMQVLLDDEKKMVSELADKNKALSAQIAEMTERTAKNDKDLDDFAVTVNSRVDEWRRLLDLKDIEIQIVRDELNKCLTSNTVWNETVSDDQLPPSIIQKEQELIKLKTELTTALQDIKGKNDAIEELKGKLIKLESSNNSNLKVLALEATIAELKEQLSLVEEEATGKAEDITKLVVQLRTYEREEFGLSDAIEQVKKLEKKLLERELTLENTIAACNQLEIAKGNIEDENVYLREKLGLSPGHVVDSSSVRRKSEINAQKVNDLQTELEKVCGEMIELKLKNRKLSAELKCPSDKVAREPDKVEPKEKYEPSNKVDNQRLDSKIVEKLEGKYDQVVEENDALRKGMQEILDNIQAQTMGDIEISSLERLLEALDARHISGWYHPAMRLQSQVSAMKGECRELRNQIRTLREEKMMLKDELESARGVTQIIEERLVAVQLDSKEKSPDGSNFFEQKFEAEKRCVELEVAIRQQKLAFEKTQSDWDWERIELVKEKDALAIEIANFRGANNATSDLNPIGLQAAVEFVTLREATLEKTLKNIQSNFISEQEALLLKLQSLKNDKLQLMDHIHDLESSTVHLEPASKVIELEQQLSSLRLQYNMAVSNDIFANTIEKTAAIDTYKNWEEIERRELLDELRATKEKLYEREAVLSTFTNSASSSEVLSEQLSILASKLSASEVREISEKQKNVRLMEDFENLKNEKDHTNSRVMELTDEVKTHAELNEKLQEALNQAEFKIRSILCEEPAKTTTEVENKVCKLISDKKNLEELLEISRSQYRSLKIWHEQEKVERSVSKECIMLLQSSPGEKLAILKMNQELIAAKKNNLELEAKNAELNSNISILASERMAQEVLMDNASIKIQEIKAQNLSYITFLFNYVSQLHSSCWNALMFPTLAKAKKIMKECHEKNAAAAERIKSIEAKELELATRKEEFVIQLEALHDLKAAFQSDSKNLVNWHNKSTELRLREAQYKKRNESLSEQLARMEVQVKNLSEELIQAEEHAVLREQEWAEQQKEWQKYQLQLIDSMGKLPETIEQKSDNEVECLKKIIATLEDNNKKLSLKISENDSNYKQELVEQRNRVQSLELEQVYAQENDEKIPAYCGNAEKLAFQVTVDSLQSIVKQKEETNVKYQELLKKTREEHCNAVRRLQKELKNVHNALAMQSKAYSRLKHGVYQPNTVDVERYIKKVQELEEEVSELKATKSHVNEELKASQHDCVRWREKATMAEDVRERLEIELERCREEMQSQEMELHNLRELAHGGGHSQKLLDTIQDLQKKITVLNNQSIRPQASQKRKPETTDNLVGEPGLSRQLKSSREECARLREQLKAARALISRPTSAKSSQGQENLVGKIRKLEEMLHLSKQHEHELEQQGLKKIKSIEEVTRWDERKRYQKNVERLENKLKQREVEVNVAVSKLETMRGLMVKMERDKNALEMQLRSLGESARSNSQMDKLMEEKVELAAQVATLEEEMAALKRHEGGKASAMLHAKLHAQERKIASLELADKAPTRLAEELDHLHATNVALERTNLQLESENLNLKLRFEKVRLEVLQLREACKELEADKRSKPVLTQAQTRMTYDSQRESNKLKMELKTNRERLVAAEKKNAELEEEIQRLLNQLGLWEEKSLADSLAKTKQQQMVTDLHQQLISVKSQLDHKVHLLDRVKILLSKAAAKEKALNEKVAALQTMVKQSG